MIVFIISILVAIVCYVLGKKREIFKNNFEIAKHILWVEACVFMAGYFFSNKYIYKQIWMVLMGIASIFSLIHIYYLKRKK